jgi:nucleotide-binding universal stress UspA family protein
MDKLTSIVAIADEAQGAPALLDKAVLLARCFNARVEIMSDDLSVIELLGSRRAERGYAEVALRGMRPKAGSRVLSLLPEVAGSGADLVLRTRRSPGNWKLAELLPMPMLLVGDGKWTPPLRIAAAVDVSEHETSTLARAILQAAGFIALGSQGDLDVCYSERETQDDATRMERAVRLAQMVREFHVGTEHLRLLQGPPEETLVREFDTRRYDILAIGAVTRRTGFAAAFGNLTNRLAEASGSDVLLVPSAREAFAGRVSARSGVSRGAAARPD